MKCHLYSAMTLGSRSKQEDCIVAGMDLNQKEEFEEKREIDSDELLLAVCDGMGGHENGDEASRFACEQLKNKPLNRITDTRQLNAILKDIQVSSQKLLPGKCGTTVAGLIAIKNKIMVFNAGDSRVYKIMSDGLKYISHDHSFVQILVDKSLIHRDIAAHHPMKNLIEFGIGPIFADVWGDYNVHLYEEALTGAAAFLLCTDGLIEAMTDEELYEWLTPTPVVNGPQLLAFLKNKGTGDNTSFIIAEIYQ